VHAVHAPFALHTWPGAHWVALRHSTHAESTGLQTNGAGQLAVVAQVRRQVPPTQTSPVEHDSPAEQPMHTCAPGSQWGVRPPHWGSDRQATQVLVALSHLGNRPPHCASEVQPTHRPDTLSQTCPSAQLLLHAERQVPLEPHACPAGH
jgi:hypothetical protein